jgi:hypothetical protein
MRDVLRAHKRSYRHDKYRMQPLLEWFNSCAAESITPQEIEPQSLGRTFSREP